MGTINHVNYYYQPCSNNDDDDEIYNNSRRRHNLVFWGAASILAHMDDELGCIGYWVDRYYGTHASWHV